MVYADPRHLFLIVELTAKSWRSLVSMPCRGHQPLISLREVMGLHSQLSLASLSTLPPPYPPPPTSLTSFLLHVCSIFSRGREGGEGEGGGHLTVRSLAFQSAIWSFRRSTNPFSSLFWTFFITKLCDRFTDWFISFLPPDCLCPRAPPC